MALMTDGWVTTSLPLFIRYSRPAIWELFESVWKNGWDGFLQLHVWIRRMSEPLVMSVVDELSAPVRPGVLVIVAQLNVGSEKRKSINFGSMSGVLVIVAQSVNLEPGNAMFAVPVSIVSANVA